MKISQISLKPEPVSMANRGSIRYKILVFVLNKPFKPKGQRNKTGLTSILLTFLMKSKQLYSIIGLTLNFNLNMLQNGTLSFPGNKHIPELKCKLNPFTTLVLASHH